MRWFRLLSVSGLILVAAGFARAAAPWVERPDTMEVYFLDDVDRLGDRVRVLYHTMPSLEQAAAGPKGWTVNVYVAETHPDGSVEQRRLATGQRYYGALLLRRGHDEALAIPAPGPPGSGQAQPLELWSTRDGSVRSSAEVAVLPDVQLGSGNVGPTDDGNLFVIDGGKRDARGKVVEIVWHKLSPRGEVLAKGTYTRGGSEVRVGGLFPARDGGIGLTVTSSVTSGAGHLATDIENPIKREFAGRTLEAAVYSETRMLVTDGDGRRLWDSPALERDFMWGGEIQIPEDLPMQQRLRQNAEQMELMEDVGLEYGARTLAPTPTSNNDLVRPTSTGYAALASKTARRDRVPAVHGSYYLEIGPDGELRREVYLEPLAERIGARAFVDFLPTPDGGVLLAGVREPEGTRDTHLHVTRVEPDGSPGGIVPLGPLEGQLEGIEGTASDPWLLGHGWHGGKNSLWLRHVDMSRVEPLEIPARPGTPAPAARARARQEAAPPAPEPEKPEGDCSCSCEEFAELQKMLARVQDMSDEEKIKLATDPEYLKRMTCAGQCGVAYSKCATK